MFPSSVMLLKLVVKQFSDQETKLLDIFKALLAFPIDIAFLSMAFGSAIISLHYKSASVAFFKGSLVFLVVCVILAIVVTVVCKKADRAFALDKTSKQTLGLAAAGYGLAALATFGTLLIGDIL